MPGLAANLCDTGRIPEVKAFFESHGELMPGYERQLRQAVEQIELCAALKPVLEEQLAGSL